METWHGDWSIYCVWFVYEIRPNKSFKDEKRDWTVVRQTLKRKEAVQYVSWKTCTLLTSCFFNFSWNTSFTSDEKSLLKCVFQHSYWCQHPDFYSEMETPRLNVQWGSLALRRTKASCYLFPEYQCSFNPLPSSDAVRKQEHYFRVSSQLSTVTIQKNINPLEAWNFII